MDLGSIVLGGLGGAVVGSMITLAGTVGLEWVRVREQRRGAGRALYMELARNAVTLNSLAGGVDLGVELADDAWRQTQRDVALLLGPGEFADVASAYSAVPAVNSTIALARSRGMDEGDRKAFTGGSSVFAEAVATLRPRVWSRLERRRLETLRDR